MRKLLPVVTLLAFLLLFLSAILNVNLYAKLFDSGIANTVSGQSKKALIYIAKETCPSGDVWEAAYSSIGIDAQYREFDAAKDPLFVGLNPKNIGFILEVSRDESKNGKTFRFFNESGCLIVEDNHG